MKKGALAATAIAVGAGATGAGVGTVAAQDGESGEVVVHAHDYAPGARFTVIADLDSSTEQELIQQAYEGEFSDPEDWDGYIINLNVDGSGGRTGVLLTEEVDFSVGDQGTFGEAASFRNASLNLVETDAMAGGGGNSQNDEPEEEPEEEEPEPEEEEEPEEGGGE